MTATEPRTPGERTFPHVLANTALANITTSFLWFALTFWVYLETRSVLATGIIGGAYMLFVAFGSMLFGSIVDHHRKLRVMLLSGSITLAAFALAGAMYLLPSARSSTSRRRGSGSSPRPSSPGRSSSTCATSRSRPP